MFFHMWWELKKGNFMKNSRKLAIFLKLNWNTNSFKHPTKLEKMFASHRQFLPIHNICISFNAIFLTRIIRIFSIQIVQYPIEFSIEDLFTFNYIHIKSVWVRCYWILEEKKFNLILRIIIIQTIVLMTKLMWLSSNNFKWLMKSHP